MKKKKELEKILIFLIVKVKKRASKNHPGLLITVMLLKISGALLTRIKVIFYSRAIFEVDFFKDQGTLSKRSIRPNFSSDFYFIKIKVTFLRSISVPIF